MGDQLTLVAEVAGVDPGPLDLEVRPANLDDCDALGILYFESYPPGVAGVDVAEATDDIRASFAGDYGALIPAATLVAVDGDGLVGAVMTVRRPPWEGLPDCPLVIELFVDAAQRGRGIGRGLMERAMAAVRAEGESRLGLRVDPENESAMSLYRSLGFGREN